MYSIIMLCYIIIQHNAYCVDHILLRIANLSIRKGNVALPGWA